MAAEIYSEKIGTGENSASYCHFFIKFLKNGATAPEGLNWQIKDVKNSIINLQKREFYYAQPQNYTEP